MGTGRRVAAVAVGVVAAVAAATPAAALFTRTSTAGGSLAAATLAPATGLTLAFECGPGTARPAVLAWTASVSTFTDGYVVERLDPVTGAVVASATVATTTYTDATVAKGEDVRYAVTATASNWRSPPVEVAGTAPTGGGRKNGC